MILGWQEPLKMEITIICGDENEILSPQIEHEQ
jgi:hypothetical protein